VGVTRLGKQGRRKKEERRGRYEARSMMKETKRSWAEGRVRRSEAEPDRKKEECEGGGGAAG